MQIDTDTGQLDLGTVKGKLLLETTERDGGRMARTTLRMNRRQASRMAHALAVYSQTGTLPQNALPLKEWSVI